MVCCGFLEETFGINQINLDFTASKKLSYKWLFYVSNQQDAVLGSPFYCTAKSLYMFRVSFAPIIRNT